MLTVFDIVAYDNLKDPYEPYWEASMGLAENLAQAVAYVARAKVMVEHTDDEERGVIIRERVVGKFDDDGTNDILGTYDRHGRPVPEPLDGPRGEAPAPLENGNS